MAEPQQPDRINAAGSKGQGKGTSLNPRWQSRNHRLSSPTQKSHLTARCGPCGAFCGQPSQDMDIKQQLRLESLFFAKQQD